MLKAFESSGGTVTPGSSLVTGYDFLADAAAEIATQFSDGIGVQPDELITPRDLSPQDESDLVWTADDLRAELLGQRHDVVFLAGHFSAVSALAADFTTSMLTTDLTSSSIDLTNAIIFSAGCHSGYNIVDQADVPGVTFEPDWAQAFAQKGATLIAGTGYQYGDTDFLEYSERLYLEFARQLRTGDGPVSVGQALVAAKQAYLATTPQMRGIHEKAYLEATLFGLPMLKVNMPGTHLPQTNETPIVSNPPVFGTDPGHTLGLAAADVTVRPDLIEHTVTLTNPEDLSTVPAFYISGSGSANKVVTNPVEPTLPLEVRNASVQDMVLRGVGFRGGNYTDIKDKLPLIGAPTTEIRGVHAPFLTSIFYPVQPWTVNYYAALDNGSDGITNLMITPAQFRSDPGSDLGTFREFTDLNLRLYYSNNTTTYGGNSTPALSDPPTIAKVSSDVDENGVISFSIEVTGNPAAGIQEVWVTYTACDPAGDCNGTWQSTDLVQNANSTLWEGTLTPDASPQNIRFIVQAVNGVGLVSMATNLGFDYVPGVNVAPQPSTLSIEQPSDGAYGAQATFSATLTSNGAGASGQALSFCLGSMCRQEITGQDGNATVEMPLLVLPGDNTLSVFFGGSPEYQASFASADLSVSEQSTSITLEPSSASKFRTDDVLLTATLEDGTGRLLSEFTIFFMISGDGTEYCAPVITDYLGRAVLKNADPSLAVGDYTVDAYFLGKHTLCGQQVTIDDQRYKPISASGTLAILNRNPVAADDSYSVNQNEILTIDAPGILSNDSDPDGDPLAVSAVNGNSEDVARQITLASGALLTVSPDGGFTYDPNGQFKYLLEGQTALDSFEYTVTDGQGGAAMATVTITVAGTNLPPDCSGARSSIQGEPDEWIWPPNNNILWPVNVIGVTDPDGDPITITITAIWQDEPVGTDFYPDGMGIGSDTAQVRAERDGEGDGRVYHIYFTASDGNGGTCSVDYQPDQIHGGVRVGVSDNQGGGLNPIDQGPLYDSTVQSK
jgi:VCBS repeat-containing protein